MTITVISSTFEVSFTPHLVQRSNSNAFLRFLIQANRATVRLVAVLESHFSQLHAYDVRPTKFNFILINVGAQRP